MTRRRRVSRWVNHSVQTTRSALNHWIVIKLGILIRLVYTWRGRGRLYNAHKRRSGTHTLPDLGRTGRSPFFESPSSFHSCSRDGVANSFKGVDMSKIGLAGYLP